MTTINVAVITKIQSFPAGTVDTQFMFVLLDSAGNQVAVQNLDTGAASFANVSPGTYTVNVTKNGVTSSSSPIPIIAPPVNLTVPDAVNVTLG